ncbi:hypothetical protein BC2230_40698 [Burkholderia cepacia]
MGGLPGTRFGPGGRYPGGGGGTGWAEAARSQPPVPTKAAVNPMARNQERRFMACPVQYSRLPYISRPVRRAGYARGQGCYRVSRQAGEPPAGGGRSPCFSAADDGCCPRCTNVASCLPADGCVLGARSPKFEIGSGKICRFRGAAPNPFVVSMQPSRR